MQNLDVYRMNGLGNEFLIIDRRKKFISLEKEQIISLSLKNESKFDQLIFIEKENKDSVPITIFNADGKEVSACGNGSRCVSFLISKEKNIKSINLMTSERLLKTEVVSQEKVKINMGKPAFEWNKIPLKEKANTKNISVKVDDEIFSEGFALNIGNPHIVFFVEDCFKINLKKFGPLIEKHNLFPERCNVTFAHTVNRKKIYVNVWERGAGLTKACGTAACAAAISGFEKKKTEREVDIVFNEGVLNLKYDENENVFMEGPVSQIKKINIKI
tara:strand:+ start:1550 stop:2368 length:819 start_codon:yes stop_codon:yes gene_type:complete